jgi:hypothetical protein
LVFKDFICLKWGNPVRARPVGARPVRTHPVRARPVRARPVRAHPVRARPVRACSIFFHYPDECISQSSPWNVSLLMWSRLSSLILCHNRVLV